jgi:hypothetical protein
LDAARRARWLCGRRRADVDQADVSTQLLSVDISSQERYIDLQRMRARQVRDECNHNKLHAEVLMAKGWVSDERKLTRNPAAHAQPLPAYFGLSMTFPRLHPLARGAQHYMIEAIACLVLPPI